MILHVAKEFPELTIIAAHLGGNNMWDAVYELFAGTANVFMETSLSYENIVPELANKIIQKHGHNKIFFGTDYPFAPIGKSVKIARSFRFLVKTRRRISLESMPSVFTFQTTHSIHNFAVRSAMVTVLKYFITIA